MIYLEKTNEVDDLLSASYHLGEFNEIKVKFDFKIPISPENYLIPISSKIELLKEDLELIPPIVEPGTVVIPFTKINVSSIIPSGFLYFETVFRINGSIDDVSLLEKYLKKCKNTYSINGGQDGLKEFYIYDSVKITAGKEHLIMRKHITLNR